MKTVKFLSHLRGLGVKLWMDGDRLRVKAPAGVLTKALKKEMAEHKEDIVRFLTQLKEGEESKKPDKEEATVTPLSFKQQYVWLRDRIMGESQVNHLAFAVRIQGGLNKGVLEKSLAKVVEHHEILRTFYPLVDSLPTLKVAEAHKPQLKHINLKHLRKSEKEDAARARAVEEVNRHMDTAAGPPVRWVLIKLSDEDHVLLSIMHRIIADGASKAVFLEELVSAYKALSSGDEASLSAPALTVAAFAEKEREWLASDACADQTAYWKKLLEDHDRVPDLPTDTPRPLVRTFNGATLDFNLPDNLVEAVSLRAEALGQSFHDTLLTGFAMLVCRYTNDTELSIGLHRQRPVWQDTTNAIGPFANEVVIRTNLAEGDNTNPSFRSCLTNIAETVKQAASNADLPFERLANELHLDSDVTRAPLFQVMFDYQDDRQTPAAEWPDFIIDSTTADHDVSFMLTHTGNGVSGRVLYNCNLFRRGRIERMIGHFQTMMEHAAGNVDHQLHTIPMLTDEEHHQILGEWNQTRADFNDPQLLHELFEERAASHPQEIVLEFGSERLSFATVNAKANQLAHHLRSLGITVNSPVATYLDNSPEMIIAFIAILKSGGAYLPLETGNPKERLDRILKDSGVNVLLTRENLTADLPQFEGKTLLMESGLYADAPVDNPKHINEPDNHACVIYTSGRDGAPMGIINTHRGICNRLLWMQATYPLKRSDRLMLSADNFNILIWEMTWPLIGGGRLIISNHAHVGEMDLLIRDYAKHNITVAHFPPHHLENFLLECEDPTSLSLERVVCSGDILTLKHQQQFFSRFKNASLYNLYGPVEAAVDVTAWACDSSSNRSAIPVGRPISNIQIYILNADLQPTPIGVPGELHIGGVGVGGGYLNRPELTHAKFIADPFSKEANARLYKTGDLACYQPDGAIVLLGRMDQQIILNGNRIEPAEIEAALQEHNMVSRSLVKLDNSAGEPRLVCYYTSNSDDPAPVELLRDHLGKKLPSYMIPDSFVSMSTFPEHVNGEINAAALPTPRANTAEPDANYPRAYSEVERVIAQAWRNVLNLKKVGLNENFFDIGGDAFKLLKVFDQLPELFKQDLHILDLFRFPTIHALDLHLENKVDEEAFFSTHDDHQRMIQSQQEEIAKMPGSNIAVIGMSVRYPKAANLDQYWENLRDGVECVSFFSKEELAEEGIDPELLDDPDYVRAKGVIDGYKDFDAHFFEITPREAQITDPQHRIFLECCWEALEHAGYAPGKYKKSIGVYGGSGNNQYFRDNILPNPKIMATVGELPILVGNDKDNLTSRVSFKLNLTGPSVAFQSACSTSLAAVHMAGQGLRDGDCDLALAGGIALRSLGKAGYLYEEGMLAPPDGHARPFSENSQGTVHGQGIGMLVLKRLEDAVADGDQIWAVIRGSAITNDGSAKAGYTAFGEEGQYRAIHAAQKKTQIDPSTISYIETSSTASSMGDLIEINALTRAFREKTDEKGFCGVGAVKPNIGHTDIASGAAALIKTVLALKHKQLPPTLNHDSVNPKIDFSSSPFYVNTELKEWKSDGPRRAGVNAFGLGGTNGHVILEEGPKPRPSGKARPWQLITLSAQTPTALETMTDNLTKKMRKKPHPSLSDLAYTLQVGRQDFPYRRMLVSQDLHEAVIELEERDPRHVFTAVNKTHDRPIAFMFPGQGAQYMNMGRQLYQVDLFYRRQVDQCWEIIRNKFPELYRGLSEKDRRGRTAKVHQTSITQFSLFVVEYALSKLLMHWGIHPSAMIANSTGEYVAACLAGVFSLEDALEVVIGRGRLMQSLPPGEMLGVSLSEEKALTFLNEELSLAGVAGPNSCMISGSKPAIQALQKTLVERGIDCRLMFAPHAFHSYMVDPILPAFKEMISKVKLSAPQIPFISSTTGTWITDDEATDPHYWARQQRQTVRFYQGLEVLYREPERVLLEVGPDKTLSSFATQSPSKTRKHLVLATLPHPQEDVSEIKHLLTTLGRLWLGGIAVNWENYQSDKRRLRIELPTYPFEREPHWIDPPKKVAEVALEPDEIQSAPVHQDDTHFRPNVPTGYVAPKDSVEQTIAGYWQEVLGLKDIGIHDDFFELGGSSLIAVRLINKLSKKFDVPLPSHILLQKRTISTLAELIKEHKVNPESDLGSSPLIEIQKGASGKLPIYYVHPIGGEIYFYRDIAHYLGADQPVFGFQAPSLIGKTEPFDKVENQAAAYVEELLKVNPHGPYILGGASYGGMVCYEMAQQLVAKGKKVPLLIVVDSPGKGQMPSKFNDSAAILEYLLGDKLELNLDTLRELPPEDQMNYVFEQARMANRFDVLPPSLGIPLFKTWMGHQTALHGYEPKPYSGRVLYFWPTLRMKVNPPNMYIPWIEMVKGGIEIHQIGGNHITMNFGDNAKSMAKHLKKALNSL